MHSIIARLTYFVKGLPTDASTSPLLEVSEHRVEAVGYVEARTVVLLVPTKSSSNVKRCHQRDGNPKGLCFSS